MSLALWIVQKVQKNFYSVTVFYYFCTKISGKIFLNVTVISKSISIVRTKFNLQHHLRVHITKNVLHETMFQVKGFH